MLDESQNIEYKESWRDEYLKWICGFANASGGRIFIGVNDNKEVIGLSNAKKMMEDIPNKIVNYLGIPLPTIEESGGGVRADIIRKTIDDVITERVGTNVGVNVGVNIGNKSEKKLTDRQRIIISIIKANPFVTGKTMSETLAVTLRTIERDLATMQKAGIIRHE